MQRICIEGLHESIRCAGRTHWSEHPNNDINKLARHATKEHKETRNMKSIELRACDVESDENRSTMTGSRLHAPAMRDAH